MLSAAGCRVGESMEAAVRSEGVHQIVPDKVTRPIQLLAAWLTGLIVINGSFLSGASFIQNPKWASGLLVVAAVCNVPIFIFSIFLLQTKFRPEMQEDIYYSKYLERKYSPETQKEEFVIKSSTVQSAVRYDPDPVVDMSSYNYEGYHISINDLLPDYQKIFLELMDQKFRIGKSFGSTSDTKAPPKLFVMGIPDGAPIEMVQLLIKMLRKYGLKAISRRRRSSSVSKEIIIGSYSFDDSPQDVLSLENEDTIKILLKKGLTWDELNLLLPQLERSK